MKRCIHIFLAMMTLVPFYLLLFKWSGRDTSYRNAYPFYLNEPRREARAQFVDDNLASPKAPYVGLRGKVDAASLGVCVRNRHIVVNMPWTYAFLIVSILPAGWMFPAILQAYRRRRRVTKNTGKPMVPIERIIWFIFALSVGLVVGFFFLLMVISPD